MLLLIGSLPLCSALLVGFGGRWLGGRGAGILACSLIFISCILSVLFLREVLQLSSSEITLGAWMWTPVPWAFQIDYLTGIMLIVVTWVSTVVHIYSLSYMGEDPHLPRFISYLSFFTWMMLVLIIADNVLVLFLGWEGVGLASYLLISFWWTRAQAAKAALKAIIVNRIGDLGVLLGSWTWVSIFGGLDWGMLNSLSTQTEGPITLILAFLVIGAVGKSAQLGLHTWLPDAMEGPTPVSALIHAATMVTAGVYLLVRCEALLSTSELPILLVLSWLAALTALFGSSVAVFQNDLKRVIAFSTCSQLGYIALCCGLGQTSLATFHLINHAFFKALLFLGAGSVIHACNDQQDIRKYGNLYGLLPFTYSLILVGSLSLGGIPFLSGFTSKDAILEWAWASGNWQSLFPYSLVMLAAVLTAFYSWRLLILTFFRYDRSEWVWLKETEPEYKTKEEHLLPLSFLAILSVISGYWTAPIFSRPNVFFSSPITSFELELTPYFIKVLPLISGILTLLVAIIIYVLGYSFKLNTITKTYWGFFNGRWFIDQIYERLVIQPTGTLSYAITYKLIDRGLIELTGPKFWIDWSKRGAQTLSSMHTGYLPHTLMLIILGIVALLLYPIS